MTRGLPNIRPAPTHRLLRSLALGVVNSALAGLTACAPEDPQASRLHPASTSPGLTAAALSPSRKVAVPIVVDWSQVDPYAFDVQEAARFATQAFAVLHHSRTLYKEVLEAHTQVGPEVSAGMNFQIKLQVQHEKRLRSAQAHVWRQSNGQYQLTQWVWID